MNRRAGWDPVALADRLDEARRQVGDGRDLEPVAQAIEDRQMHGLGHGTEAQDADANAIRHGKRCAGGAHRRGV